MPPDFLTPGPDPLVIEWNYPTRGLLGKSVTDLKATIPHQPDMVVWIPPSGEVWGLWNWRTMGKKGTQDAIPAWVTYEIENGKVTYVELSSDEDVSGICINRTTSELVVKMIPRTHYSENARMWGKVAVQRALAGETRPLPPFIEAEVYC